MSTISGEFANAEYNGIIEDLSEITVAEFWEKLDEISPRLSYRLEMVQAAYAKAEMTRRLTSGYYDYKPDPNRLNDRWKEGRK